MKLFYFSLFTVLSTWILLAIGGLVNPMGASLACPDWYFIPTCNGEIWPEMTGGVLYEHGHRLWASLVGFLTVILFLLVWFSKKVSNRIRYWSLFAIFLVAFQGTLGGVTVLMGLSAFVSTLHLITAMGFFCLLIYITFNLYPGAFKVDISARRGMVKVTIGLVLLQILLGGLVRHVGAGLACGDDWMSCGPSFWPDWHLGQLHMLHRLVGYFLAAMVACSCIYANREAKQFNLKLTKEIVWLPIILTIVQIALGLATVATVRSVSIVFLHTAVGALLLASLFLLYLSMHRKFNEVSHTQNHLV
ncbi:MAG: COX15/CtaA family protein [bacterium]|nr:COX15/CtaA family protein [bacterium]